MSKNYKPGSAAGFWLSVLRKLFMASFILYFVHGFILPASAQTQLVGLAAEGGAYEGGTIFQINPDGTGLTTLYNFQSSTGSFPIGSLIQGQDGLLYGVSKSGGSSGFGTIFRIEPNGSNYSVVFNFTDQTGYPAGSLLQSHDEILFGVTTHGDAGFGTAYRINPDGSGYTELYRFPAESGYHEPGNLIQASNGAIYGTTYSGGAYMYGQVFRMNSDGSEPIVLRHFSWEDGESPYSALVQANDGALYGVTNQGGYGGGIVYQILPNAAVVSMIRRFNFSDGGYYPGGSLVQAPDGALYGMTIEGGPNNFGSLYKVNTDRSEFTVLEYFDGNNGKGPVGNLTYYNNKLYGYTTTGGLYENGDQSGYGVIFSYDLATRTYTKLVNLDNASGKHPMFGGLLLLNPESAEQPNGAASAVAFTNVKSHSMTLSFRPGTGAGHLVVMKTGSDPTFHPEDDKLYFGDIGNGSTVVYNGFKTTVDLTGLTPDATHYFSIYEYNTNYAGNIRYLATGAPVASQRTLPYSQTTTKLVGVTAMEGKYDAGSMFSVNPDGTDYTTLFNFGISGGVQLGTLFKGKDGYLYGFSKSGGSHATGTLYKIKADGTDYTVVYNFTRDDGFPAGPPVQTMDGTLFGVSTYDEVGYGMVYKVNPDGSGHQEIYRFEIVSPGYHQPGFVMQASNGYLFATTYSGGDNIIGMILRMNQDGSQPLVVHSFSGNDGYFPYSVLTEASDGALYGVTQFGGIYGNGCVYKIQQDGSEFSVVYNFDGYDVSMPAGGLVQLPDGALAGIANFGGEYGWGSVYKVYPDGTGFKTLQPFDGETDRGPIANLTLYENKLYGYAAGGLFEYEQQNGWGLLFSYDLATAIYQKPVIFTPEMGVEPTLGSLLVVEPSEAVIGVQNFSVVNVRTDEKLIDFENSVSLDLGDPDFGNWTIRANTYPNEVGSVVFKIDDEKKNVENKLPYLLQKHYLRTLSPTSHILEAEAYSERNAKGTRLQSRTTRIDFINNTMVTGFEVLDINGDKVQDLNDGDVLNVQDPRLYKFNIGATLNRNAAKGSVKFYLNGEPYRTENLVPYTLVSGKRKWWGEPGLYTVSAVPFSGKNAKGLPGTPATVSFYISNEAQSIDLIAFRADSLSDANPAEKIRVIIYPVPAQHDLNISAEGFVTNESGHVIIWDMDGKVYFDGIIQLTNDPFILDLDGLRLQKGIYFIRIRTEANNEVFRFLKE